MALSNHNQVGDRSLSFARKIRFKTSQGSSAALLHHGDRATQSFPLLKLCAWNETMHVHLEVATMLESIKTKTTCDCSKILGFEATR